MTLTSGSLAQFLKSFRSQWERTHSFRKGILTEPNKQGYDILFIKNQKPSQPPNLALLTSSKMSVLSVSVINVGLLAKIFSVLCTGRTVTDSSILLKGLDHSDKSVENNEIGLGKNCTLMCNSEKLDVS